MCQGEKWMLNVSYLIRWFCDTKQIGGILMMFYCSFGKCSDSFCSINKKKTISEQPSVQWTPELCLVSVTFKTSLNKMNIRKSCILSQHQRQEWMRRWRGGPARAGVVGIMMRICLGRSEKWDRPALSSAKIKSKHYYVGIAFALIYLFEWNTFRSRISSL